MRVLKVDNVNYALPLGIELIRNRHWVVTPRAEAGGNTGMTLECPEAVCTEFYSPLDRVLFYPERNKNHFFEFFEALWILAGRQDVKFLDFFNKKMVDYSDDGEVFNAPYGYRLRSSWGFDQLHGVCDVLLKAPFSRRAVAAIWDPKEDLNTDTVDVPCNDLLMFKFRGGQLNLTVSNRSNDVLWGAYGTNCVQFATILEYVAMQMGVTPGRYTHISDSFHVYPENPLWEKLRELVSARTTDPYKYPHKYFGETHPVVRSYPLIDLVQQETPEGFDADLKTFFQDFDKGRVDRIMNAQGYHTLYFKRIVSPLFSSWVGRDFAPLMEMPLNSDWRLGAWIWLKSREERLNAKD